MNVSNSEYARRLAAFWMACDCDNRDKLEAAFSSTFANYQPVEQAITETAVS